VERRDGRTFLSALLMVKTYRDARDSIRILADASCVRADHHNEMSLPTTIPTPHRTPLRRLSQGSLSRLSRSAAYPDAPHGLGFLEPALGELLDEIETLHGNVQGLRNLSDALGSFNESFASWLYVMHMNALTTDWPQAPTDASFRLAARRAGKYRFLCSSYCH
jgi:hypothetical protein